MSWQRAINATRIRREVQGLGGKVNLVYYNEFNHDAAAWLRLLIDGGAIPAGDVDTRSICEVSPDDLDGYSQCHFFAGIGGWPLAARYAGWPDDRHLWTGSCPCQPFSDAGKGLAEKDERHLWPEFRRLIAERNPSIIVGEQVASKLGRRWLAGVRGDLETLGYGVGAADLCAASVGAAHIRQRLYWFANAGDTERERRGKVGCGQRDALHASDRGAIHGYSDAKDANGRRGECGAEKGTGPNGSGGWRSTSCGSDVCRDADADQPEFCGKPQAGQQPPDEQDFGGVRTRLEGRGLFESECSGQCATGKTGPWDEFYSVVCRDIDKRTGLPALRRVGCGVQPLAYGVPARVGSLVAWMELLGVDSKTAGRIIRLARRNRVGRLRGYGNAIVPWLGAQFLSEVIQVLEVAE